MCSRIVLLTLLIVTLKPARAAVLVNLDASYAQGTFQSEKTFPISGAASEVELAYDFDLGLLHIVPGANGKFTALSYQVDGLKKPGNLYQSGFANSLYLFLGNSFHIHLKPIYWVYSKFYTFSDASVALNDATTRTQTFTLYDGGAGVEGELGLMFSSVSRKGGRYQTRYGIAFSGFQQTFTGKSERVVLTSSNSPESDVTTRSAGAFTLLLGYASLVLGTTF